MSTFPLLLAVISAILLPIIIPLVNANGSALEENDDFDLFVGNTKEQFPEKVNNLNGKEVIETKLLGIFKDDQISNLPTLFDNISHVEKYLFSNFCPLMSHMEKMSDASQPKSGKSKLLLHLLIEEICKSNNKRIDTEFQEAALNEFFVDKELAGKIEQLTDQLKNILMKKIVVVVGNVVNKKPVDTDETNNNNLLQQQQHAIINQLQKIQRHVDNVFGKISEELSGTHLLISKNDNKISVWIREVLATGSDVLWPSEMYGRLKELWQILQITNQRKELELLKREKDDKNVNKIEILNNRWPSSSARVIAAVHRRRRRRSGFRLPLPSQAIPSGNNDGGGGMNPLKLIIVVLLLFLALNMQQVLLALQFIFPLVRQEPQLLIFLLGGLVTMGFHLIAFLDRHHIATLN